MKRQWLFTGAVLTIAALFAGTQTLAQVQKGTSRVLQTKHWMKAVNGPMCTELGALLKDDGPSSDEEWMKAAQHAEMLNEASYVLMADGRCPDATWANATTQLREGSAAVIEAIHARNASGASAAFGNMVKACGTCHDAHKQ